MLVASVAAQAIEHGRHDAFVNRPDHEHVSASQQFVGAYHGGDGQSLRHAATGCGALHPDAKVEVMIIKAEQYKERFAAASAGTKGNRKK